MKRTARAPKPRIQLTWFGHSAFRLVTPGGTTILIDPWLENPASPPGAKDSVGADVLLVTHGHSDHVGNTAEIGRRTGATVIAMFEVALHLREKGVENVVGMNKGGTVERSGIAITMTDARHSSGIDGEGATVPGGEAAGFVIRPEKGPTVYHAGDTCVFGDMQLIARLYRPSVALLPIGDLYTMGPREAALACRLLDPQVIIGMHYGTFPALTGTPAALRKLLPASMRPKVRELEPGLPIFLG